MRVAGGVSGRPRRDGRRGARRDREYKSACAYINKKLCDLALKWYMFSEVGDPGRALLAKVKDDLWLHLCNGCSFLMWGGTATKGKVFCTLMRHNGGVFVKLNDGEGGDETKGRVFWLCKDPYPKNPLSLDGYLNPSRCNRKIYICYKCSYGYYGSAAFSVD